MCGVAVGDLKTNFSQNICNTVERTNRWELITRCPVHWSFGQFRSETKCAQEVLVKLMLKQFDSYICDNAQYLNESYEAIALG